MRIFRYLTRRRLRAAFRRNFAEFKKSGCPAAKVNVAILANRLRDLDASQRDAGPGIPISVAWRFWCPLAFGVAAWAAGIMAIFGYLAGLL